VSEDFAALLAATARRHADKVALAWDGGQLRWAELDARARRFAGQLSRRGIRAGDRVAIALPNGWPFVVSVIGTLKAGATVCPLNPRLTAEERETILADLAPALLVTEAPALDADGEDGAMAAPDAVACARTRGAGHPAPAIILYTSGSTGQPKGAVISHGALAWANRSWAGPVMRLTAADVVLGALPLSHAYGFNAALLAPLLVGSSVFVIDRFSPEAVADAVATHGVTVFPGVATMFRRILDAPDDRGAKLGGLRLALSGAAPCPWQLAQEWRDRTGVRILRGYGMTELFRPISYLANDPMEHAEAIGRPVPGVDVCVVDEEDRPLPPPQVGELWIRSPGVMDGYLNAPVQTRAVLNEGWFHTGDLASITADGFVRIVGRKKELILSGGYSVSPPEIETVLLRHPAVAEAAVVGLPHAQLGEEVVAFVSLRPMAPIDGSALLVHCKEKLAGYKCPRRIRIIEALPRSATGKILKARLTDL
jgi:long-chain acyl-CoA synthetase